ncbi:MAG: hydrogenase iron-sulfur subunit [Candidatus Krumholzibacteriota bacterium]|nr:hydrogenase iron-sulfur subunit [Candidatus Krumholzibacteriota bacterium]
MHDRQGQGPPRILVFSTDKISDPAIDLAGLLKLHYPPTIYTVIVPCSSGVKPRWIMHALARGFDGVFIAADGTDCPYSPACTEHTGKVVGRTHEIMKNHNINPSRLRMAAICSVCSEAFVRQMKKFHADLAEMQNKTGEENQE